MKSIPWYLSVSWIITVVIQPEVSPLEGDDSIWAEQNLTSLLPWYSSQPHGWNSSKRNWHMVMGRVVVGFCGY